MKVALLVIYNHRFDKNIDKIESLYGSKFSYIYHIVPFYDGEKENVISVYENSYYFSGYIAQAYRYIRANGFTHYFFIADDMLLNPSIDENTLWDQIGIKYDECCLPFKRRDLENWYKPWSWFPNALNYNPSQCGIELMNVLPSFDDANQILQSKGIKSTKISFKTWFHQKFNKINLSKMPWRRKLKYPMVSGYSDILLVTDSVMPKFSQLCGIFAATHLFVEIAIPTALYLSANKILDNNQIKLHYGALWGDEETTNVVGFANYSINNLYKAFPKDLLFIHPIKLSKWTIV